MITNGWKSSIVFASVMLANPVPGVASGTVLTGLWRGMFSCEVLIAGEPSRIRTEAELAMSEDPATGIVYARVIEEGNPAPFFFSGVAARSTRGNHAGRATLVLCDTDPNDATSFREVVSGNFNGNSREASFQGTGLFSWGLFLATGGECKFAYRRVETRDPGIGPCPPR
jgi:hypothetical protein